MDIAPGLRRLALGLAVAIALAGAVVAGFFVFLHTAPGERWTATRLEGAVAGLHLDNYRLGWPFRMRADAVVLADGDGPWLRATGLELVWHPLRLWRRLLDIDRLAATGVEVLRLPVTAGGDGDGGRLPVERLHVDEVRLPIRLDAAILGEALDLDLSGTARMDNSGGGGDVDVSLRTRDGDLARFAGTAGTDFVDLRWYLRLPDLGRWQRLAGLPLAGVADGTGIVAGRLPTPEISGRIDIGAGGIDRLGWRALTVSGRVLPQGPSWQTGLRAEASAPSWAGAALPGGATTLAVAATLDPDAGKLQVGLLRLDNALAAVEASGRIEQWGRHAVARLRAAATLPTGRLRLRGMAAGDLWAGTGTARLAMEGDGSDSGSGTGTGSAILDRLLGPRPRASIEAHVNRDRLSLGPSRLNGAGGTLTVQGLALPRLDLWGRLDLPSAAALAEGLGGGGTVVAHLGGQPQAPRATGLAPLAGITLAGAPPVDGSLAFDLSDATVPRGSLSADLAVAGMPVTASARLDSGAGPRLDDLRVSSGDSVVRGAVEFAGGVRGRLSGTIPELRQWQEVLGRPLSGRIDAEAVLDPGAGQSLHLTLSATSLTVDGIAVSDARAAASATTLNSRPRLRLEQLAATLHGVALRLEQPAELVPWRDGIALSPTRLSVGGGRAVLGGRLDRDTLAAQMRFESLPLAVAGLGAVGTLSGTAEADGRPDAPRIRFAMSGRNLALANGSAPPGLGRLLGQAEGEWQSGRLNGRADLSDGAGLSATAEGGLPLPGDGPLDVRLAVSGDAARLMEALPLAGHVLSGHVDGAASLGGTLAAPRLDGHAELARGRYENLDSGTIVAPLHAIARLNGDRGTIQAEGGDGQGGSLRLTGRGDLDGSYGADLALERFAVLRRDDIDARADGRLRLEENRLSGRLTVPRAEIDIGRLRGGGPARLEVTEINRPGTPPLARPAPPPAEAAAGLDLAVTVVVERAFVRGRGLDSEWQGTLNAAGTTAQPSLTGKMSAVRGTFDVLGKVFRLSPDSTVTFQGGDSIDPALAVVAEANAADIAARVHVDGTARAPELTFTSSPPLAGDEVLARLLFGRAAGTLSAFQQIQLAQMAAGGLTGGDGGFDPLGDVRGFLGLDVLGVGSESNGGASGGPTLSAGKYVGPDTFVRVEQGVTGLGRVAVEQELGGGFAVESSVGAESGGGLGLTWRRDY